MQNFTEFRSSWINFSPFSCQYTFPTLNCVYVCWFVGTLGLTHQSGVRGMGSAMGARVAKSLYHGPPHFLWSHLVVVVVYTRHHLGCCCCDIRIVRAVFPKRGWLSTPAISFSGGQFQMNSSKCKHKAGQPKINTKDRPQLCHFTCSRMLSVCWVIPC